MDSWLAIIHLIHPKLFLSQAYERDRMDYVCNSNVHNVSAAFMSISLTIPAKQMAHFE